MKFFLKRKLKEHTEIVVEESRLMINQILNGYEFIGKPTSQQLKSMYAKVIADDIRRSRFSWASIIFQDSPLTVNFLQNKILYPLLETYVPPEINGKILLMEQCEFLLELWHVEQESSYRPEAEISVIWNEIGAKIIGKKAFWKQHENEDCSKRFSFIKKTPDKISSSLEQFIFGDSDQVTISVKWPQETEHC